MNFTLKRLSTELTGIYGTLLTEDQKEFCVTLERNYGGKPKIPVGTYRCVRYLSPHLGYEVFMLKDVPNHDHIEMHIANFQTQLDGCIALGGCHGDNGILDSRKAFEKFMSAQEGVKEFTLTVK